MAKDLNLTSSGYSLVLSIFFVAYLLFEVPSNMILARSKPSIFLPTLMVTWVSAFNTLTCTETDCQGAVSVAVKGIDNIGGMIAFRIALGLIEAGFFPGVMLLLSCWYKVSRDEGEG
jgi:MFS family permease